MLDGLRLDELKPHRFWKAPREMAWASRPEAALGTRQGRPSDSPLLTLCEALAQGYEDGGKRSRCLGARFPKLSVYEHLVRDPVVHRPRPLLSDSQGFHSVGGSAAAP